jgi:lysophospholipase L1-like esterase
VASCVAPGEGARPPSGLSTIKAQRGRLGTLVVIALGYNDRPQRRAIDRLMQELRDQGVQRVAWINLSERRSGYRDTNRALTAASLRWPELRVLDWRSYSAGRGSWFIDGVHLTATGRLAFAHFLARSLARMA